MFPMVKLKWQNIFNGKFLRFHGFTAYRVVGHVENALQKKDTLIPFFSIIRDDESNPNSFFSNHYKKSQLVNVSQKMWQSVCLSAYSQQTPWFSEYFVKFSNHGCLVNTLNYDQVRSHASDFIIYIFINHIPPMRPLDSCLPISVDLLNYGVLQFLTKLWT